ncbi:hypothetical protein [Flavobacterium sp. ZS1P14]|uniref:hypothetical protein n=1 Tax=Flavobacterium sp. ZS1P14 TaxID=3401729 RepID=UPI003AB07B8A
MDYLLIIHQKTYLTFNSCVSEAVTFGYFENELKKQDFSENANELLELLFDLINYR